MTGLLKKANLAGDSQLTRHEPNAAGRMGLYRIFYALFYLWHQHDYRPTDLGHFPQDMYWPMVLLGRQTAVPPPEFFQVLETGLIAGLVLLVFGYRTKIATAVVAFCGIVIEAYYVSTDFSHATIFLMAYIPIIMLLIGDWGATFSIDAVLRRSDGYPVVSPADTSPRFVVPIHAIHVILCILFTSAGLQKIMPWSTWFEHENFFGHLFLERRIESATRGLVLNPGANLFYDYRFLDVGLRWFVVAWETCFFLSLINRKVRYVFVFSALIFHAMNSMFLVVGFTGIFVVYPIFFDWVARLNQLPRVGLAGLIEQTPTMVLRVLPLVCAAGVAGLWTVSHIPQRAISLGGLLSWHTIWYPVIPIACIGLAWALIKLFRSRRRAETA